MPRSTSDKFFIYAAAKSGRLRGKRLLGVNSFYGGDQNAITVADLVEFLKSKGIEPSQVLLPPSFSTVAKA